MKNPKISFLLVNIKSWVVKENKAWIRCEITFIWFGWHFLRLLKCVGTQSYIANRMQKTTKGWKTYRMTHTIFDFRLESTKASTIYPYRSNSFFHIFFAIFGLTKLFLVLHSSLPPATYKWKGNQLSFSLFYFFLKNSFARFSFLSI